MNKDQDLPQIVKTLQDRTTSLAQKTVTLGFDGFIDEVVRVVLNKDHERPTSYFESGYDFGRYIVEKGEKNFSLELEEITTKLGGNMPIMANAISQFGPSVSCIGPLGYPHIHPVFKQMPSNCQLHSFADPGVSKVLEFAKGKIMLAEMESLNRISWEFIMERVGLNVFVELFDKSDLVALLNWSELDNSTGTWKGLLRDVLPRATPNKKRLGFFDLSDCSKRTDEAIKEAIALIQSFSAWWNVTISLNLNEATIIHSVLTQKKYNAGQAEEICKDLFEKMQVDTVMIHSSKRAIAVNANGLHKSNSFFIETPAISTGSGDNFNAGFCLGRLLGCDVGSSLVLGHATSNLYMQTAHSPSINQLINFLSDADHRSSQA